MFLSIGRTMKERITLDFDELTAEYLKAEAAVLDVTPSQVAMLAVRLLSHYRRETADGSSMLISPAIELQPGLQTTVVTVPQRNMPTILAGMLNELCCDFSTADPENGGPHLRLVRPPVE